MRECEINGIPSAAPSLILSSPCDDLPGSRIIFTPLNYMLILALFSQIVRSSLLFHDPLYLPRVIIYLIISSLNSMLVFVLPS